MPAVIVASKPKFNWSLLSVSPLAGVELCVSCNDGLVITIVYKRIILVQIYHGMSVTLASFLSIQSRVTSYLKHYQNEFYFIHKSHFNRLATQFKDNDNLLFNGYQIILLLML